MCEMSGGTLTRPWRVFLLLLLVAMVVPVATSKEAVTASCLFGSGCVLPCSFTPSADIVIHWIQLQQEGARAHSYYYNDNQLALQHQRFRDRTSLYDSEVRRGNASLLLRGIGVEDQGRYKCYTSTVLGYTEQIINLVVNAPVGEVTLSRTDGGFACSSEHVYPQPELSWSTQPPSKHLHNQSSADFHRSEAGLFSVRSSLNFPHGDSSVSCSVQTRSSRRKTTLMAPVSIQVRDSTARLFCSLPADPPTCVSWSFNHRHILNWSSDQGLIRVSEEWKQYVMESQPENLTLKAISTKHEGIYVCEARSSEETVITEEHVEMEKSSGSPVIISCVVVGVVVTLALGIAGGLLYIKSRRRQDEKTRHGEDGMAVKKPLKVSTPS